MTEEFEQAAATAEMPAGEMPEAEEQAGGYDTEPDRNMEWEVETEPAEPDVIVAAPQQQAQEEGQPYGRERGAYRQLNKHLFVWLFNFVFGMYGADRFARGQVALGVFKLLTFGGLGMWYLADLIIAIVKAYSGEYLNDENVYFDVLGRYV